MFTKNKKDYTKQDFKQPKYRIFRKFKIIPKQVIVWLVFSLFIGGYSLQKKINNANIFPSCLTSIEKFYSNIYINISSCFINIKKHITHKKNLLYEMKKLENIILAYEKQLFDYNQLQEENNYLRSILPIVRAQNLETITVIQHPIPSHPFLSLTYPSEDIYKKIQIGNIVLSPQGLIGHVIAKKNSEITVLLATHIQSKIPIISTQSRKRAILFGKNTMFFSLKYVQPELLHPLPFIKETHGKSEFIEGEILEFFDQNNNIKIPVARIVKKNNKIMAEWLVKQQTKYITILITH